ncbi:MAG TPA: DNA primase [Lachnospiraceae bacterium]|nr:DNA primase [Lachnospiraceae bacterium]
MGRTKNEIIDESTDAYIKGLNPANLPPPETMAAELTKLVEQNIVLENALRGKGKGFRIPETLCFDQIAQLMVVRYRIIRVPCTGSNVDTDYDLLAIYVPEGPEEGTYSTSDEVFYKLARRFNRRITSKVFEEVLKVLRAIVPRVTRCMDRDLIAVNNGIFNYRTKKLHPFTPDLVFTVKSHVNYNDKATNIVIHNDDDGTDWDVESWIAELSDDPDIVDLIWQILGAIIRPHVRWNKSAWFYSEEGNNGKGTLCELMRSLCGEAAFACIPLCDFSKDFALEPLTRYTAIIVDENNVGIYIDKVANLKAVITNDVIPIDRKFKTPISYQFYGFMVQCLNEFPRIRDKSDSFYRRQLFIPFEKCFTGRERKYIKEDYLHRKEVLEYVLFRVLSMNYYELSEPERYREVLDEYKEFNDPVRQFFKEMVSQFVWDILPFSFLYELYKAWLRKNNPGGIIQGKNKFITELVSVVRASTIWYCKDKKKQIRSQGRMERPEPLIIEYGLEDWKDPDYHGDNPNRIAHPKLKVIYRGLVRVSTADMGPGGPAAA